MRDVQSRMVWLMARPNGMAGITTLDEPDIDQGQEHTYTHDKVHIDSIERGQW